MQGNLNENVKTVQALDPDNYAASAHNGTAIDTRGYQDIEYTLQVGDMGTNGTIAAKVQESDASGSGYADITGAAITAMTQASPDQSNKAAIIRIRLQAPRKRYQRIVVTPGTAASDLAVSAKLSGPSDHKPITQPSYVDQVVSVE